MDDTRHTLTVATSDPTNLDAFQELAFHTGRQILVMVSSPSAIERAIRVHYHGEFPLLGAPPGAPVATALGLRAEPAAAEPVAPPPVVALASSRGPTMTGPREVELNQRIDALTQQVTDLQRMVASQARALHGMVELLESRGLVDRAAYLAKVRGG
jgi:type IV pilus assembly protein PilB